MMKEKGCRKTGKEIAMGSVKNAVNKKYIIILHEP